MLHFFCKAKYKIFGLFLDSCNKYDSFKSSWSSLWECQQKMTVLSPSWTLIICSVATWLGLYRSFYFQESVPSSVAALLPRLITAVKIMPSEQCCLKMCKIKITNSLIFSSYFFPESRLLLAWMTITVMIYTRPKHIISQDLNITGHGCPSGHWKASITCEIIKP